MNLVPVPRKVDLLDGNREIALPVPVVAAFKASARFLEALQTFSSVLSIEPDLNVPILKLHISETVANEEGYRLSIRPDGMNATSRTETGLFRALTTFAQLLQNSNCKLPYIEIEDRPDLTVRGFMLDISRCRVPTQESLFELVDQLAALKYNQLQLYTEHTFAYTDHQTVWQDASPLTADEIHALDTYCHNRYIELVPNQNSFGHMDRWLRHDAYKHLAECPDGYIHPILGKRPWGGTLKPNQNSIEFVSRLYDELLPNFRSKQINIGGDEPWELGQGWSEDVVAQNGKQRVYLDHLLAIEKQVSQRGRNMQFWGDILLESPDLANEIPDNATGLIWGYEADHPFEEQCSDYARSGKPFYIAPGTSNWNSIGGRYDNLLSNIKEATRQAIQHGAHGMLLTSWGDFGHHHFFSTAYPGLVWGSTLSWNQDSADAFDDIQAINTVFLKGLDQEIAELIVRLAQSQDAISHRPHNRTVLNDILFANSEKLSEEVAKTSADELKDVLQALLNIKARLAVRDERLTRIVNEIDLSVDLLVFATEKGLRTLGIDSPSTGSLQSLSTRYRDHWLASNRPGGLDESADYFDRACE